MLSTMSNASSLAVSAGRGITLRTTPVYDTYWRFAVSRQEVFHRRVEGEPGPWTTDPIISNHRFTNAYRASDRVSQFLIREVLYKGSQTAEDIFFRCLLFKFFNRIDTWHQLVAVVGEPSWRSYDYDRYAGVLDALMAQGGRVYSPAYIMPSPQLGNPRKHRNHLRLLERMMNERLPERIATSHSLQQVFESILAYPSMGPFLAFQFAIDLNYSEICNFSEMDFVVAGPGARDGIRKCFVDTAGFSEADIIRLMADRAELEFGRLGLKFRDLWGRSLQLIDCQNLFCEVDKYARVAHPEYSGASGRTRIKQRFQASPQVLPQWYPPKWKLSLPALPSRALTQPFEQIALALPLPTATRTPARAGALSR
jgi:hypothetical protein